MLSVLPTEMEAIRASQSKMIEKEGKLEKKKNPTSTVTQSERALKKVKKDENRENNTKEENKEETRILLKMLKLILTINQSQVLFWTKKKVWMSMSLFLGLT